jgi:hypothetical protein
LDERIRDSIFFKTSTLDVNYDRYHRKRVILPQLELEDEDVILPQLELVHHGLLAPLEEQLALVPLHVDAVLAELVVEERHGGTCLRHHL